MFHVAGWTYCGVAALALVGRIPTANMSRYEQKEDRRFAQEILRWLASRQTCVQDDESDDGVNGDSSSSDVDEGERGDRNISSSSSENSSPFPQRSLEPLRVDPEALKCAGFNGRCNKPADTCYSWWVNGSLAVSNNSSRNFRQ